MEPLLLPVAEFPVGAQHDLQKTGQVLLAKEFRNPGDSIAFVGRNLE